MNNDRTEVINAGKDVLTLASENIMAVRMGLGDSFYEAVNALYKTKGNIVVSGIGKSGIISKKVAATLSSTGVFGHYIHPTEAFHGDFGMIGPEDTFILFSNSGETHELIDFLKVIRQLHSQNIVISVTAVSDSTLATESDIVILTCVERESNDYNFKHIPTTSTTVTLAVGDALAIGLQKMIGFKHDQFFKFHPGGSIGRIGNDLTTRQ